MYIAYFTALGITLLALVVFYVYMKKREKRTNKKMIYINYGLSKGEVERYVTAGNNTSKTDSKIIVDSYQCLTEEGNDLLYKESFSFV